MSGSLPRPARDQVDLSVEEWAEQWPDLDVSAMEVFGRLHRIFRLYEAEIGRVFEECGINAPGFGVLAALYRSGPPYRLRVGDLADRTLVSTGGMTQRLDRLEVLGLVRRVRDAVDRRVVHAVLTEAGLECARRAAEAHFANERRLLQLVPPDQRLRLADALRDLEESVTSATAHLAAPA